MDLNLRKERGQKLIEKAEVLKTTLEDWKAVINEFQTPQELKENHRAFVEDWKFIKIRLHLSWDLQWVTSLKELQMLHRKELVDSGKAQCS